jgi:hypothetical protein
MVWLLSVGYDSLSLDRKRGARSEWRRRSYVAAVELCVIIGAVGGNIL